MFQGFSQVKTEAKYSFITEGQEASGTGQPLASIKQIDRERSLGEIRVQNFWGLVCMRVGRSLLKYLSFAALIWRVYSLRQS